MQMKFSRRNIFGLAAGAAVGGPSIAREAMAQTSGMFRGGSALLDGAKTQAGYGYAMDAAKIASGDYRIDRIAQLKAVLAGEAPEDKRQRQREMIQHLEKVDEARLDTLRSVSLGRKHIMLADGRASRYQRMREMDAQWELEELENNLLKFPWNG